MYLSPIDYITRSDTRLLKTWYKGVIWTFHIRLLPKLIYSHYLIIYCLQVCQTTFWNDIVHNNETNLMNIHIKRKTSWKQFTQKFNLFTYLCTFNNISYKAISHAFLFVIRAMGDKSFIWPSVLLQAYNIRLSVWDSTFGLTL